MLEGVMAADWSPGGGELAVLRAAGGKHRIEYPLGKVLYETANMTGDQLRISPDAETAAFAEIDTEHKRLRVVDRKGSARTLVENIGGNGGSWLPGGDEILWITEGVTGWNAVESQVHAVTLSGRDRVVASLPFEAFLHDVAADGRMLVERFSESHEIVGKSAGEAVDRSLTWLDYSTPAALSADGGMLLFSDRGDAAGTGDFGIYLRKTDGSPPVRLGDGNPLALSRDGKWALARRKAPKPHLVLLPTGAGQERSLSTGSLNVGFLGEFLPDGKRIVFQGSEPGHGLRFYEQNLENDTRRPLTPEGRAAGVLSLDGAWLAAVDLDRNLVIYPTDPKAETSPRTVTRLSEGEFPQHWSKDGRTLLIVDISKFPIRVDRLDLASARRTLWRSLSPEGLLGTGGLTGLLFSADEQVMVVGYLRRFSELLVIDGLK